jgi:hypothetical protein
MRTFLIIFLTLLLSACGLMPPKVESVEQDLVAPAIICGDTSVVFTLLWYDTIIVNVIAVDDQLTPTFQEKKRNLVGVETIPNLDSYCMNVSAGEHKITLLAVRERGMGKSSGHDYYLGTCVVRLAKSIKYTVVPKRSGDWYSKVMVLVRARDGEEPAEVCELTETPRNTLFDLLKDMRR